MLLMQDLEFLHELSGDHLAMLAGLATEQENDPGEVLFQRGSEQTQAFLLTQGRVRTQGEREVREVEKTVLDVWTCVANVPHSLTASCTTPCTLLLVAHRDFLDALSSEPELAAALLRGLAQEQVKTIGA